MEPGLCRCPAVGSARRPELLDSLSDVDPFLFYGLRFILHRSYFMTLRRLYGFGEGPKECLLNVCPVGCYRHLSVNDFVEDERIIEVT